ncbi:MAG TPA: LysM peptidoglycan-binding domain-containing protein [Methylomirabilota bacterium]|nr:LysM peptidoglycan-binding domain-containing protein [Methylomirabilota bacterium]
MRVSTLLVTGAVLLAGCATVPPRAEMVSAHHQRARMLERDGQLRAALLEWKIARTIDPDDAEARTEQGKLEARIQRRVTERLAEARAAAARGAHVEARRRLLAVLALEPDNAAAVTLLRASGREGEFVLHTVRAGETLGGIAERYYGDRSRSEVIWETNRLPAGRPLVVGSTLKVPEISGLPLTAGGGKAAVAATTPPTPPTPATPPTPPRPITERGPEEPPEVNPMLADIRDAIDRKDYAVALGDIDRYIALNPGEAEAVELKKLTLYRQGYTLIEQKSYDEGYKTLRQLARLQPDYLDTASLVQQARRQVIDHHYQEGIRHFREERLQESIAQWRIVLDVDPQHPNARRNIEQAERLLEALERRKTR